MGPGTFPLRINVAGGANLLYSYQEVVARHRSWGLGRFQISLQRVKQNFVDMKAAKAKILEEIQSLNIKEQSQVLTEGEIARRLFLKEKFAVKVREEEIKWKQRSRWT